MLTKREETLIQAVKGLCAPKTKGSPRRTPRSAAALALLDALVGVIDERVAVRRASTRAPAVPVAPPSGWLSAREIALVLKISEQSVRNLEHAGKLFSVLSPLRHRGRRYPAFLTWDEVAGTQMLEGLEGLDGQQRYEFFTSPHPDLAGLSALQVWVGSNDTTPWTVVLQPGAAQSALLKNSAAFRHSAVYDAARAYRIAERTPAMRA
jgi:hypothetical protein